MRASARLWVMVAFCLLAADDLPRDLDKIEAALKSAPNIAMLHYRKCQALFTQGKEQQAVDHAAVALTNFKKSDAKLSWMLLGSFKTDRYRVDVHYNMGPAERAEKKDGIVRPYSFRVWTTDANPRLVRILDFEQGYLEGELLTAAIGEMVGEDHANLGIVKPDSDFTTVKKQVVELLAE